MCVCVFVSKRYNCIVYVMYVRTLTHLWCSSTNQIIIRHRRIVFGLPSANEFSREATNSFLGCPFSQNYYWSLSVLSESNNVSRVVVSSRIISVKLPPPFVLRSCLPLRVFPPPSFVANFILTRMNTFSWRFRYLSNDLWFFSDNLSKTVQYHPHEYHVFCVTYSPNYVRPPAA